MSSSTANKFKYAREHVEEALVRMRARDTERGAVQRTDLIDYVVGVVEVMSREFSGALSTLEGIARYKEQTKTAQRRALRLDEENAKLRAEVARLRGELNALRIRR